MGGHIITIDGGTTNTRAYLFDGAGKLLGEAKRTVGVRDTARDGDTWRLKHAVRDCLEALLSDNGLCWDDVSDVLCSGMLTSNVGLVEIPHLTAPVSPADLARGARRVAVSDVCPLPITFIPGVKNACGDVTDRSFEAMDMMRGEEVETFALLECTDTRGDRLIVLPGSHTKFVSVDAEGRIAGCLTTITGELLDAVTKHTILADAVARRFVSEAEYDMGAMLTGFEAARRAGLGRACFSARILSTFSDKTPVWLSNYLMGACLEGDAEAVRGSKAIGHARSALVAGRGVMSLALSDALAHAGLFEEVRRFDPGDAPLSGRGALMVARHIGLEGA
ncbi:MAG: 2-dehydro-3-deoxygalactonokinase [Clostridiales bacterium]|nr:2-dehydro-3-deoxygalactonokinase [Clostridiales bacterium]